MFFTVLDRIGLVDRAVAKRMGYGYHYFSKVRRGHHPVSERFAITGTAALRDMGIINPATGHWYTMAQLFNMEKGQ